MLPKLLEDAIRLKVDCRNWRDAIKAGTELLIRKNGVLEGYAEAIIANHLKFGPYIVVAPGIVLAHASPGQGVLRLSMSLITLKYAVAFNHASHDPVRLILTLAAVDDTSCYAVLSELMEVLVNEQAVERIIKAGHESEVIHILKNYSVRNSWQCKLHLVKRINQRCVKGQPSVAKTIY